MDLNDSQILQNFRSYASKNSALDVQQQNGGVQETSRSATAYNSLKYTRTQQKQTIENKLSKIASVFVVKKEVFIDENSIGQQPVYINVGGDFPTDTVYTIPFIENTKIPAWDVVYTSVSKIGVSPDDYIVNAILWERRVEDPLKHTDKYKLLSIGAKTKEKNIVLPSKTEDLYVFDRFKNILLQHDFLIGYDISQPKETYTEPDTDLLAYTMPLGYSLIVLRDEHIITLNPIQLQSFGIINTFYDPPRPFPPFEQPIGNLQVDIVPQDFTIELLDETPENTGIRKVTINKKKNGVTTKLWDSVNEYRSEFYQPVYTYQILRNPPISDSRDPLASVFQNYTKLIKVKDSVLRLGYIKSYETVGEIIPITAYYPNILPDYPGAFTGSYNEYIAGYTVDFRVIVEYKSPYTASNENTPKITQTVYTTLNNFQYQIRYPYVVCYNADGSIYIPNIGPPPPGVYCKTLGYFEYTTVGIIYNSEAAASAALSEYTTELIDCEIPQRGDEPYTQSTRVDTYIADIQKDIDFTITIATVESTNETLPDVSIELEPDPSDPDNQLINLTPIYPTVIPIATNTSATIDLQLRAENTTNPYSSIYGQPKAAIAVNPRYTQEPDPETYSESSIENGDTIWWFDQSSQSYYRGFSKNKTDTEKLPHWNLNGSVLRSKTIETKQDKVICIGDIYNIIQKENISIVPTSSDTYYTYLIKDKEIRFDALYTPSDLFPNPKPTPENENPDPDPRNGRFILDIGIGKPNLIGMILYVITTTNNSDGLTDCIAVDLSKSPPSFSTFQSTYQGETDFVDISVIE